MTTLETVLLSLAGVETIITAIWVTRWKRKTNRLLMVAAILIMSNERKMLEIEAIMDSLGAWPNAR